MLNNKIVIADTSPLISMIKIKRLDLLEELFGSIVIPEAVFNELTDNNIYKDEADCIIKADFIKRKPVADKRAVNILKNVAMLDDGESEAIVLFDELNADLLIIDERKGRTAAENLKIPLTGTIGILLAAFDKELASKQQILQYIDIFQREKRRLSPRLINILKLKFN